MTILALVGAQAQEPEKSSSWEQEYYYGKHPALSGTYKIYGGELGDVYEPKSGDAKVSFYFDGKAAADIFKKMGKDSKNILCFESGERFREKGDLMCRRNRSGRYSCSVGVDINSGKSIPATGC